MPYALCILLFVGLEIIAFITGVVGRRSPYGKAGLGASFVLLLLSTFFVPLFPVSVEIRLPMPKGGAR